jgi:hypothetical protein
MIWLILSSRKKLFIKVNWLQCSEWEYFDDNDDNHYDGGDD